MATGATETTDAAVRAEDRALAERFCEALWFEDGLARNTLDAYRRDLLLYARWLAAHGAPPLAEAGNGDLQGYLAARHPGSKATSVNRRLAVFRRFHRWLVREGRLSNTQLVQKVAHAPAQLFDVKERGFLREGY